MTMTKITASTSAAPKIITIEEFVALSNKYNYSLVTIYLDQIDKWNYGEYHDWRGRKEVSVLCGNATETLLGNLQFEGFFVPAIRIPFKVDKYEVISDNPNYAKLILSSENGCFIDVEFMRPKEKIYPLNGRFVMDTLHDPENIYTNPYYRDEHLSFEDDEKIVNVLNVHRMDKSSMPWISV